MANYTLKNLKDDVKDAAPDGGLAPGLEAHFAGQALELEESGVSYFRLAPDRRLIWGGRARFSARTDQSSDARSGAILKASLRAIFPQLGELFQLKKAGKASVKNS